jgi:hypothetical protein
MQFVQKAALDTVLGASFRGGNVAAPLKHERS